MYRIFIILFLCFSSLSAVTYRFSDTMTGLVAGWHFDENTGSTTANVKFTPLCNVEGTPAWETGASGSCLHFQVGDWVNIKNQLTTLPQGGSPRTVGLWYKWDGDAYDSADGSYFFNYGGAPTFWDLGKVDNVSHLTRTWRTCGQWQDDRTVITATQTVWTHMLFSYDGMTEIKVYENGVYKYAKTITQQNTGGESFYEIGGYHDPGYSGRDYMDEIAVTNSSMTDTTASNWYLYGDPAGGGGGGSAPKPMKRKGFSGMFQ